MAHDFSQFLHDLRRQVALCARLVKLAAQQRQLVLDEKFDELLALLDQRQQLVAGVTLLETRLRPVKQQWAEWSVSLSADDRAAAQQLLAQSRELLGQIAEADNDDVLVLQQRKIDVARQLRSTGQQQQVNHGYAAAAYGTAGNVNVSR